MEPIERWCESTFQLQIQRRMDLVQRIKEEKARQKQKKEQAVRQQLHEQTIRDLSRQSEQATRIDKLEEENEEDYNFLKIVCGRKVVTRPTAFRQVSLSQAKKQWNAKPMVSGQRNPKGFRKLVRKYGEWEAQRQARIKQQSQSPLVVLIDLDRAVLTHDNKVQFHYETSYQQAELSDPDRAKQLRIMNNTQENRIRLGLLGEWPRPVIVIHQPQQEDHSHLRMSNVASIQQQNSDRVPNQAIIGTSDTILLSAIAEVNNSAEGVASPPNISVRGPTSPNQQNIIAQNAVEQRPSAPASEQPKSGFELLKDGLVQSPTLTLPPVGQPVQLNVLTSPAEVPVPAPPPPQHTAPPIVNPQPQQSSNPFLIKGTLQSFGLRNIVPGYTESPAQSTTNNYPVIENTFSNSNPFSKQNLTPAPSQANLFPNQGASSSFQTASNSSFNVPNPLQQNYQPSPFFNNQQGFNTHNNNSYGQNPQFPPPQFPNQGPANLQQYSVPPGGNNPYSQVNHQQNQYQSFTSNFTADPDRAAQYFAKASAPNPSASLFGDPQPANNNRNQPRNRAKHNSGSERIM